MKTVVSSDVNVWIIGEGVEILTVLHCRRVWAGADRTAVDRGAGAELPRLAGHRPPNPHHHAALAARAGRGRGALPARPGNPHRTPVVQPGQ